MSFLTRLLAVTTALVLTLAPATARADWLQAETEHFRVHGDMSEGDLRDYARKVERFHAMMERFMPPRRQDIVAPKLDVYVTDGRSQMRQIWPTIAESVGGFYSRGYEGIYAVADERDGGGDTTLFHEYAHHYMFQHQNEAYPGWFVEGFAEYFAPSDLRMGKIEYGLWREGRLYSLAQRNNWVPMEDVLRSRLQVRSPETAAAYYAQAWLLTHYMLGSAERNRQMSAYLGAVMRGADPIEALTEHVGTTPDQLERDMRTYFSTGMTTYKLQEALPVAEVTIKRMPRSAGDVLFLNLRAAREVPEEDRAGLLRQAQTAAARHPGDRLAAFTLAKVQRAVGDRAAARATLETLVASHPRDSEALWLLSTILIDQADDAEDADRLALKRQANAHLAVAYDVDPLDFRIYRALARNRRDAANYPTDSDMAILESAYALAPQLPANGMDYARALMTRDRHAEAAVILAPLASNPHGGSAEAQQLLAEARQKAGLTPAPVEAAPPAPESEAEPTG
jgi:hypothetical protein